MMSNRILEIVVFLMDYLRDRGGNHFETEDVSKSLRSMGYSDTEITSAYSWLVDRFETAPERYFSQFPEQQKSTRVLTGIEQAMLTVEGQGLLLKLINLGLVDAEQFEEVVDRLTVFGSKPVTLEQVKMIASTVLFRDLEDFEQVGVFDPPDEHSYLIN